MPPHRVAVDLRALVPHETGIGVYTRALLLELAGRDGFLYTGLAHRPPREGEELAAAGIATEQEAAPLGVIWQQLRLPRRLGRGDFDLLWSPLITLPLRCPVPAVATVHDLTTLLLPETHRLKNRWSILPFLRPSLERADRLVTISQASARDIAFHFPQAARKVRVIYPGIDPGFRPGTPEEIAAIRQELGAPEGYILYVGTLEPRKNVGAILDAWEILHGEDPHVPPLVLAGAYGWGSQHLLQRIETLAPRGVRSLGHVDRAHLVRIFQGARAFVYPSLYEGFGLPPAEAMACGIPVVVSDASSLPEVVGNSGLRVPPGDTGALAQAMRDLLREPARAAELAARGMERAGRFRWDRAAEEMEEVFREAVSR
jgi:glycosyltransferase involved in cell wall biosynthesis